MLDYLIQHALKMRGVTLALLLALAAWGGYEYTRMPVDAFPDLSPVMVPVFAEAHGMAPEEIERLISYPIESAMNGLPGVQQVKSTSAFGMAVIYVYFRDDVDIYFARQLVAERLASAQSKLPALHEPPTLGPIATGLGQIFLYYLTLDPGADTAGQAPLTYLRDVNDWLVKYQLQTVPGVTEILSMGGHVLQYQIRLDPHAMRKYGVDLDTVIEKVQRNNRNAGGQVLVIGSEEYLVRGLGLLQGLEQLHEIPVKTGHGARVLLGDLGDVVYGPEMRRGVVTRNGQGEVVSGMVLKLYGENTSKVIGALYRRIAEIQTHLPKGVRLVPYYEQAALVRNATQTVKTALWQGAVLVIITLVLFLGRVRTSLIVALALPFCSLVAVVGMRLAGLSANLMSLGGIAIAIGMLGDGAIVMVENISRHLAEGRIDASKQDLLREAAREVARPIVFSIAIIILVFVPLLALEGIEGKMFKPMAQTIGFALGGSLLAALFLAPVLSSMILRRTTGKPGRVLEGLERGYGKLLGHTLGRPGRSVWLALLLIAGGLGMLPRIGTEFMPALEEGSILIGAAMAPSISLEAAVDTVMTIERRIMAFGEVEETVSRIGRPEAGSHPHPVNYAEIHVSLKPRAAWTRFKNKAALIRALNEDLKTLPGVNLHFTQPIQNAFDELLSGLRTQLAVKLYGEDLGVLRRKADEIQAAIRDVPGLVDLSVEQSYGQPQIQIEVDRDACARYGVEADAIMELVEKGLGGEAIGSIYRNTRRYDIQVRYREDVRADPVALGELLVPAGDGAIVPLKQVATVREVIGPIQINREKNQRRWMVQGNVRGRDLGHVAQDIRRRVAERVTLPPGYLVEYGGQFENQQRAMRRLSILVPLALAGIFALLCFSFGTFRHAAIILLHVPVALVGGLLGLLIMGEYLSVPASVGFIALFGIAVQNGLVLVSCFRQQYEEHGALLKAVQEGARRRLRPVLMTALTTIFGLLPMLLSRGAGSEIQRPLASVVVFGLATSTLLTLFILPCVYLLMEQRRARRALRG